MDLATANRQRIELLPCIAHEPDAFNVLFDATSFRETLHQAIETAITRIYLVALYLQDDEAGRAILTALYEAKQRQPKLDICVFVDWHRAQRGLIGAEKSDGNAALYREFAEKYEHSVQVMGVPIRNREVFGVLHLKGFIIDDTVIYSGASLNDVYLNQNGRYRCDRYHVIKNIKLANSMVEFIQNYFLNNDAVNGLNDLNRPEPKNLKLAIRQLRQQLQQSEYHFTSERLTENQVGLTPLVGLGKRNNELNHYICALIGSAKNRLIICTPYFNFPRIVAREVQRAIKRGVEITLIVGDKTANDFYIPENEPFKSIGGLPYLYEMNLRQFAKHNEAAIARRQLAIHLWKDNDNSFHLKGMWVDEQWMLITGNNMNPRAWKLDLENAILIHDKHQNLAEIREKEIDVILSKTTLVGSYRLLEKMETYPASVKRLLKRIRRIKADRFLNQIL
jgi:CDP-diacylglycerol--serine O-phosphatidyltransferase